MRFHAQRQHVVYSVRFLAQTAIVCLTSLSPARHSPLPALLPLVLNRPHTPAGHPSGVASDSVNPSTRVGTNRQILGGLPFSASCTDYSPPFFLHLPI